jgi:hypothetical protein
MADGAASKRQKYLLGCFYLVIVVILWYVASTPFQRFVRRRKTTLSAFAFAA